MGHLLSHIIPACYIFSTLPLTLPSLLYYSSSTICALDTKQVCPLNSPFAQSILNLNRDTFSSTLPPIPPTTIVSPPDWSLLQSIPRLLPYSILTSKLTMIRILDGGSEGLTIVRVFGSLVFSEYEEKIFPLSDLVVWGGGEGGFICEKREDSLMYTISEHIVIFVDVLAVQLRLGYLHHRVWMS